MPMPDDDDLADKYVLADEAFEAAGLGWYEVSNWARDDAAAAGTTSSTGRARLVGVGPGAHSHVDGERWWNVKHPSAYAARLAAGESPAQDREVLDDRTRRVERVLLEIRLRDGLPLERLARPRAGSRDLVDARARARRPGRGSVLTRAGRLLADGVVRELV